MDTLFDWNSRIILVVKCGWHQERIDVKIPLQSGSSHVSWEVGERDLPDSLFLVAQCSIGGADHFGGALAALFLPLLDGNAAHLSRFIVDEMDDAVHEKLHFPDLAAAPHVRAAPESCPFHQ